MLEQAEGGAGARRRGSEEPEAAPHAVGARGSRAEEAAAFGHKGLAAVLDGLSTPFFFADAALRIRYANAAFASYAGTSTDGIAGRSVGETLGPEEFARLRPHLEAALSGETRECEAGGEGRRQLKVSVKPVNGGLDAVEGVLCELSDVTDLRRAQQEAETSDNRFKMLVEGVPNQLLFLDPDLRIEFANEVFLQAIGWTAETARGKHISDILGRQRYLERRKYYDRALSGESVSYESTGAAGSRSGYFRFSYRPSFDSQGRVRGIFSLAVDITERRNMELELEAKQAELVRSNRDLEQFAYVASHDLKAPLRAIDLLVQWIREELDGYDSGDVQENLELLTQRTQRLGRLLDDLLAYSRAGRKVGECRHTDCRELVLDALQLIDPPEGLVVDIEGELPAFETYPAPLEQVLRNLINNAVKHHPGPPGRVSVSCEEREDSYIFAVQDDGDGIAPEYAERVFEMFQTLKPRDQIEGSGMGLAIVNRIVTWQGGRVWFEPVESGSGAVFKFEWRKQPPSAGRSPEV